VSHLPLGPGGEFDRIRQIIERVGSTGVALGDDCALVEWPGGTLALSTDATIEDVHFRRAWLTEAEIGWRAAARALSDLAAEGAEALGILVALTAPRAATAEALAEVMGGAADAVGAVGGRVLGGDLAAGDRWHLVVTVVGAAARPVTRAGAEPGNELWVTGALGGARAALDAWLGGLEPDPTARRAFASPTPRIAVGVALAAAGARAMVDLSDGLGGDARHLAAASATRLVIDLDRLPLAPTAGSALDAARGGEDYELLVAMPAGFGSAAAGVAERTGVPLTKVGRVEAGTGVLFLLAGVETEVAGWDHFVDAPRRLG
jgi:thiamine-monophosphate kinase